MGIIFKVFALGYGKFWPWKLAVNVLDTDSARKLAAHFNGVQH